LYDISQQQADNIKSELRQLIDVYSLAVASGTTKSKQQRPPSDDEQPIKKI
jgi:hypothetical protein